MSSRWRWTLLLIRSNFSSVLKWSGKRASAISSSLRRKGRRVKKKTLSTENHSAESPAHSTQEIPKTCRTSGAGQSLETHMSWNPRALCACYGRAQNRSLQGFSVSPNFQQATMSPNFNFLEIICLQVTFLSNSYINIFEIRKGFQLLEWTKSISINIVYYPNDNLNISWHVSFRKNMLSQLKFSVI